MKNPGHLVERLCPKLRPHGEHNAFSLDFTDPSRAPERWYHCPGYSGSREEAVAALANPSAVASPETREA